MNRHLWLVCWGMLLLGAAGVRAQEIEGTAPAKPAEQPGEASPILRAIRGVMGLGQNVPQAPVTPQMKAAIDEAIRDLAADDYNVREAAARRLIEIGHPALAALQEAAKSSDAEVRFRAGQLLSIVQSRVLFDSRTLAGHEDIVWTVAWSHSGRLLASGGGGRHNHGNWSPGSDFAIRVWDPSTQRVIRTIEGHAATVNRLVWSDSDNYLLSASSDGTARIWRAKDGSEFRIFRGHEGSVSHALFTPGEKQVITAGWDKTIRIWDVKSGKELRRIDWPEGRVWGLDLSPDGALLAVCGDHPTIRLYNFHDGKPAQELKGHGGNVAAVKFSPDGTRLASGAWDNSARIWDVKDFKSAQHLSDHTSRVEGLAWSDDGKFLVTGCLDAKVRVYDAAKGVLVRAYEGHSQGVSKVAVSPLGDAIASGGWDSEIRLWPTTGIAEGIALGLPPLAPPPGGVAPAVPAPAPVPLLPAIRLDIRSLEP